jgi:hypothetical protein
MYVVKVFALYFLPCVNLYGCIEKTKVLWCCITNWKGECVIKATHFAGKNEEEREVA